MGRFWRSCYWEGCKSGVVLIGDTFVDRDCCLRLTGFFNEGVPSRGWPPLVVLRSTISLRIYFEVKETVFYEKFFADSKGMFE